MASKFEKILLLTVTLREMRVPTPTAEEPVSKVMAAALGVNPQTRGSQVVKIIDPYSQK